MDIFKGTTDQSLFFELVDSSTGLPKTGIVYTSITAAYVRTRIAKADITPATLASAAAAHSDGGFILVNDTTNPGLYRLDVPDAAFATGAPEVIITIVATGCRIVSRQVNLVDINNQVAYAPNAAASGVGGLLTAPTTANTGLSDVTRWLGTAAATPTVAGVPEVDITHINGSVASDSGTPDVNVVQISGDSTAADNLEAACDGTGYNVGGGSVVAASVTGAVGSVTGSVGGNVTGSVASVVGAVGSVAGNVGGNVVGSVASVAGAVGSVAGNIGGNVTGTVGSLATQAKADVNAEVVDVLATDTFAELASIPAATSSLKDKLTWMFMWFRNKVEQTATTKVLKADNGTTTVATFTESDDGTTYTSGEGV